MRLWHLARLLLRYEYDVANDDVRVIALVLEVLVTLVTTSPSCEGESM